MKKEKIKNVKKRKMKLHHNKKLFWVIIVLILVLISLMYIIGKEKEKLEGCIKDSDCVASSCCHADSCVASEEAPECDGVICSMVCSGPLDCGAGECGCVKGECIVREK